MAVAEKLLDWLWQLLTNRRRVRVLIHFATLPASGRFAYFINVVNLSRQREVEITHVWFDCDGVGVPATPDERPLPRRLKPDEAWETWIEFRQLPDLVHAAPYERGRVRLSTGRVVHSREDPEARVPGWVPGGPPPEVSRRVG